MTVDLANPGLRILPADIPPARTRGGSSTAETSFGEQLQQAVMGVDQQQQEAQYKVSGMLEGNGTDVHEAMIAVQKADLSFQLMLQVRNKVVQAYQEIERMQF
jgi:flagellar hook-basal body complex protein FliE